MAEAFRPADVRDICNNVPLLVSRLGMTNNQVGLPLRTVPKCEALMHLWNCALKSSEKREDMIKCGVMQPLVAHLNSADAEERHAAVGCLLALCSSDDSAAVIISPSVVGKMLEACYSVLRGAHDRSKLPATQLIQQLASRRELAHKVEQAIPHLVQLLASAGPQWADSRVAKATALSTLHMLLTAEWDKLDARQAKRIWTLQLGILAPLCTMLQCANPATVKTAAATVRQLSAAPGFFAAATGGEYLQQMLAALTRSPLVAGPSVCGVIWELAADPGAAQVFVAAGALPAVLAVLRAALQAVPKAKRAGAKAGAKKARAPSMGPELEALVCNATGALQHLSFVDTVKADAPQQGAVPLLVELMERAQSSAQCYENITGTLWNLAMLSTNRPLLLEAGAPQYLAAPTPDSWATVPSTIKASR